MAYKLRSNEPGLYSFNLYSKVWPKGKPPYMSNSFRLYCRDDESAYAMGEALASAMDPEEPPEEGEPDERYPIANFGRFGVRKIIYQPYERDYEIPSGYSPVNVKWVYLDLRYIDPEGFTRGIDNLVIPGVADVDALLELFRGTYYLHLIRCFDGTFRQCNDVSIRLVETYDI